MRTTTMDQKGHSKRATPAVMAFRELLSTTTFAQRDVQRWVPGWLWLATIQIAQLSAVICFRF